MGSGGNTDSTCENDRYICHPDLTTLGVQAYDTERLALFRKKAVTPLPPRFATPIGL